MLEIMSKLTTKNIPDIYSYYDSSDVKGLKEILKQDLSGTSCTVKEYEKNLSNYFNTKFCLATSSGTSAITLALHALSIEPGDLILVAPTCPLCTIYPILLSGASIIFCDTQKDNFSINLDDAASIISKEVKAIIDVPMWGYPTPADQLRTFAKDLNIPLVFDLAHCHGTKYKNRNLSEFCDIACFSTHQRKVISTGEGGFMLTNNSKYYNIALSYSRFGHLKGKEYGLNYKLSSLQAALGLNRLMNLDHNLKIRKENSDYLINNIRNKKVELFKIVDKGIPNYYCLLLRINDNAHRFLRYMDEYRIPSDITRFKCKVLYRYPALKSFYRKCPNAESLLNTITTIPVHPGLTKYDLNYILNKINSFQ